MNSPHKEGVTGVFSRAAPTYDTVGPRHFEYFARHLVEFTGVECSDHVLDVATGASAVAVAAAEKVGEVGRIIGIDLASAMLERAAATVRDRRLIEVELRLGDAEHLDFPAAAFDVVMCSFGLSSFANM